MKNNYHLLKLSFRSQLGITLILIIITTSSPNALAARKVDYCQEYGLGWNFYCQDLKTSEQKENLESEENYQEKLEEIKKNLEDKKAKAIIYPSEDNLRDYMNYQKMVLNKSSNFADVWRRTLWKTPELDYTLFRPTSKMGKEAWVDNRNQDIGQTIRNINERYGIFFIFRGDCPYCHKYSPILKGFQEKYGITIMAVSMDGGSLPNWQKFLVNKGQVEKMGLETRAVPATILFDKETRQFIPVGFGVLSYSDLEERIYAITKLEVGNDF